MSINWSNFTGLFLNLVKSVATNPTFQSAAVTTVSGIGKQILDNLHAPAQLEQLGQQLVQGAPAIVGAIVKGTEAQNMVDPAIIVGGPAPDAPVGKSGSS